MRRGGTGIQRGNARDPIGARVIGMDRSTSPPRLAGPRTQRNGRMTTKSNAESQISQAIIAFEKEFMGRGPAETRTHLLDDLVLVRLKKVLTPAEHKLAQAEDPRRGRYLVKQVRQELIERGRPMLNAIIEDVLGVKCISLHTDISTKTGERIIVFTLARPPQLD